MPERSILLAGGGTAGHVNPLLAVAAELRRRDPQARVTVLGTSEGLESQLVPEAGLPLVVVPRVPMPRRPTPEWFGLPGRLRGAVRAADRAILDARVEVVVGFGGYVSTPAYLAAHARRLPIVVHEQNARPGVANRLGARWATRVAVTFPGTRLPRAVVTGLPLRPAVVGLLAARQADPQGTRARAAADLGLAPDLPTLLVTGGSLGAVSLNTAVAAAAADLLDGAQVLHLTGAGKAEAVRAAVRGVPGAERYHVREYLTEMEQALAVADVVVCRAGAGTVSELTALGLPAVYVPLPVGNGEQRFNAAAVVQAGGGLLVADGALTPAWLHEHVRGLLVGPGAAELRARMGAAAESVGILDATARVADLVEDALAEGEADAARRAGRLDEPAPAGVVPLADLGRTHLLGVGGAGMSVVAELLAARGVVVSGCDAHDGPALGRLRAAGLPVVVGHDVEHVEAADTLVVTSAVRQTTPELVEARRRGLRVLHRSQALVALMAGRDVVAVAGAHGKTTTSAMVAAALVGAGLDPSVAIGGTVLSDDGSARGARAGAGRLFVAEADESDGSFLVYRPTVAVVTNVEPDHLDHYGTTEAFEQAFVDLTGRIVDGGLLVACADDAGARRLVERTRAGLGRRGVRVVTYGTAQDADVVVGAMVADADRAVWSVPVAPRRPGAPGAVTVALSVPGAQNALDAAAAWLAAVGVGADPAAAAEGLAAFRGTARRFEVRGRAGGVLVVDDYAHHPTEVDVLLRQARSVAGAGRVLVVFQPHLYSRTRTFAERFAQTLDLADVAVVTDVYAAREERDPEVSGETITRHARRAVSVPDRHDAARRVAAAALPGDLVLTVGAGDVTELGAEILELLAARS